MADVFITYARPDRQQAHRIASVLNDQGFTVWYDFELLLGQNFMEAIYSQINAARVVIVLWSRHSVQSSWVLQEAEYAYRAGKLIPIMIDQLDFADIPRPFNVVQSLNAAGRPDREVDDELTKTIARFFQTPGAKSPPAAAAIDDSVPIAPAPTVGVIPPAPTRKAFISYASEDEGTAIDLVKHLESSECSCWISFRDVDPGEDYRDSIMRALVASSFLVLVYSKHANESFDVATELLLARKKGKRRFVLKTDESEPDGKIEYELATVQWIDCIKDVKGGFQRVAQRAQLL